MRRKNASMEGFRYTFVGTEMLSVLRKERKGWEYVEGSSTHMITTDTPSQSARATRFFFFSFSFLTIALHHEEK